MMEWNEAEGEGTGWMDVCMYVCGMWRSNVPVLGSTRVRGTEMERYTI